MQDIQQKIFGGVLDASQILQLVERRIPFQMVYDTFEKRSIDADVQHYENYYPIYNQQALSISGCDRFKLLSASEGRNFYMLETDDGKLLNLKMETTKGEIMEEDVRTRREKSGGIITREVKDDIGHELDVSPAASGLTPNFLFALHPQADGRVVIQSSVDGNFIRLFHYGYGNVGIGTSLIESHKKSSHNEELAVATKFSFVTERTGIKQIQITAADWIPIFGGLPVMEQIEQLSKFAMPFFLLAIHEKKRYFVNVQKEYVVAAEDPYECVRVKGEPNAFTFVSCGGDKGNVLISTGNGEFLSVCKFEPKLSSAELMFESKTGAPMSKFLFDLIPRSPQTFVIRSHYNDKFVRTKICYFGKAYPIDATNETAIEFVLSPISMLASLHDNELETDEKK